MDVYVLTDACGFSVCLAIAVYMQFMSLQMRVGFLLVLLLSAAVNGRLCPYRCVRIFCLFSHCCLHAVYVLTDACGFSACAAAVCCRHLPVGGADGGEECGAESKGYMQTIH